MIWRDQQRSPVDDILDSGKVDEEPYLRALSGKSGMDWVASISEFENIESLRSICGPRVALAHQVLPAEIIDVEGAQCIVLLTYDPLDLIARQAATQQIDLPIIWRMASRRRIHEALRMLYGVGADTFEQILEGRDLDYDNLETADEANVIDADEDEEASVVKFVNQIIREALQQRATDIHVEPLHDNLRIRYRIDGLLVDVTVPDKIKALQSSVISRGLNCWPTSILQSGDYHRTGESICSLRGILLMCVWLPCLPLRAKVSVFVY